MGNERVVAAEQDEAPLPGIRRTLNQPTVYGKVTTKGAKWLTWNTPPRMQSCTVLSPRSALCFGLDRKSPQILIKRSFFKTGQSPMCPVLRRLLDPPREVPLLSTLSVVRSRLYAGLARMAKGSLGKTFKIAKMKLRQPFPKISCLLKPDVDEDKSYSFYIQKEQCKLWQVLLPEHIKASVVHTLFWTTSKNPQRTCGTTALPLEQ